MLLSDCVDTLSKNAAICSKMICFYLHNCNNSSKTWHEMHMYFLLFINNTIRKIIMISRLKGCVYTQTTHSRARTRDIQRLFQYKELFSLFYDTRRFAIFGQFTVRTFSLYLGQNSQKTHAHIHTNDKQFGRREKKTMLILLIVCVHICGVWDAR